MADEPADMTLELLRHIRAEQEAFRECVEHRFGMLKTDMLGLKHTLCGPTYMTATFNGRPENMKARVERPGTR